MEPSEVIIYTDGACSPNPGPGGWAAVLLHKHTNYCEISGGEKESTNNRMEIMAVIQALRALKPSSITIYSDSQYVVNAIGNWLNGSPRAPRVGWIIGWQRRGWAKRDGDLKNTDLWQQIWGEVRKHKEISLAWVRGHANNEHNNRCDALAVAARRLIVDSISSDGLRQNGIIDHPDGIRTTNDGQRDSIGPLGPRLDGGDGNSPL